MRQLKCFFLTMFVCGAAHAIPASEVSDRATLKAFVQAAKMHLEQDYQGALGDFQNSTMWKVGSIYLFTVDENGVQTFSAGHPELNGRNLWDLIDVNGVKLIQELLAAAAAGGGFVEYRWNNPAVEGDEKKGSPKVGYAEMFDKPDGTRELVGSGIYPTQL